MARRSEQPATGVDRHGNRWRVRKVLAGRRYVEHFAELAEANDRAGELDRMRRDGAIPAEVPAELTLAELGALLLTRKATDVSHKTKRKLRGRGLEWWARIVAPWVAEPFAGVRVSRLRRTMVEDHVRARAVDHPKTAKDELAGIKAMLVLAGERGLEFDRRILDIRPPVVERRRRRALTVAELELLASCAPAYGSSLLLFKGTVGCRINELATLTDDRVFLEQRAIFIPAALTKEGADKWVELTSEETALLREQLVARPAGIRHVWATATGQPFEGRYPNFHRFVWQVAQRKAAKCWRLEHGPGPTPFDELTPHDLRATAATLMRDAGFSREQAAARLGHADSGELLARVYDVGDQRARNRRALDALAPAGLRTAVRELEQERPPAPAVRGVR